MLYPVNEIFYSIQGEGFHSGTPAIFIRLAGCNLKCPWCDTDHSKKVRINEQEIVTKVLELQHNHFSDSHIFVIITGGEPTIHNLIPLCKALHKKLSYIAVETNGVGKHNKVLLSRVHFNWITLSPKYEHRPPLEVIQIADEIKIVYDKLINPLPYQTKGKEGYLYIQPCSGDFKSAVCFVLKHPEWKLSLQIQKIVGVK